MALNICGLKTFKLKIDYLAEDRLSRTEINISIAHLDVCISPLLFIIIYLL